MTLLSDQQTRIQFLLQETDTSLTRQQQIAVAHQERLAALSRTRAFGAVVWLNAIADQALYTLPTTALTVEYVLYNERMLRYAGEHTLDRLSRTWERPSQEPEYWTLDNQNPNTIRIVPQPLRTGSAVLDSDFAPMAQDTKDNLVVFLYEDVSPGIVDPGDTLPCLNVFDDWLVYASAYELAMRETDNQNVPVGQLCQQLANLWAQALG